MTHEPAEQFALIVSIFAWRYGIDLWALIWKRWMERE